MTGDAPFLDANTLSEAGAGRVIDAARAEAAQRGVAVSIAVLDRGGFLVGFVRMDGIHAGTVAVSIAKARTAVLYNRATSVFASGLASGNMALLSLPDMVTLPGGVPLATEMGLAGAIGVSGAAPEIDEAIALAGRVAFEAAQAKGDR